MWEQRIHFALFALLQLIHLVDDAIHRLDHGYASLLRCMDEATTCMLLIVPFMCVLMSVTDIGDDDMLLGGNCATRVKPAPAAKTTTFMDKRPARFIKPPESKLQSMAGIVR